MLQNACCMLRMLVLLAHCLSPASELLTCLIQLVHDQLQFLLNLLPHLLLDDDELCG